MSKIFFDLDGTLINSQHRLYQLFVELCKECQMSYEAYWAIKRQRITQKDFLQKYFDYTDEQCVLFHKKWLEEIEKPKRMKQDFVVQGIEEVLKTLLTANTLYIATNRQSVETTLNEIKTLGLEKYFDKILVTEQKVQKADLIQSECISKTDIFVTDTGEDIKTAHELGIKSVAVSWGVLSHEILEEYQPNAICDRPQDLIQTLTMINKG